MHVDGPEKFLARWYPVSLGQGAWLNPRNTHVIHLSYHAQFGHCTRYVKPHGRQWEGPENFSGRWDPAPLGRERV